MVFLASETGSKIDEFSWRIEGTWGIEGTRWVEGDALLFSGTVNSPIGYSKQSNQT